MKSVHELAAEGMATIKQLVFVLFVIILLTLVFWK
uniref:Uncharacterized protein n=1 Tax=Nelumbo nucifera TaxID=4432 RepID=A0A822XYY4_NELNU|nr:TPA_asm: hypothetical protein HUJ06_025763 [Nelumbo nucifera]